MQGDLDHVTVAEERVAPKNNMGDLSPAPSPPSLERVFVGNLNLHVGIVLCEEPEDIQDPYQTKLHKL